MDLHEGQTARRSMQVNAGHIEMYAELTGDLNPLHFDEEFASGTKFGRLVAPRGNHMS